MGFWAAVPIIGKVIDSVLGIIDKNVADKDLAAKLKAEAQMAILTMDHSEFMKTIESQASIITAEANATSWLTKSWRPMVMLMFAGMLLSHWLGYTPANLEPEMVKQVFSIIKIGLGGYVVGRSAEKTIPKLAEVVKKK